MTQKATVKQQLDELKDVIETAITQAAELSGLRNWLIYNHFKDLEPGEWPNVEAIVQAEGESLLTVFANIIDPDDADYLESEWYKQCDTENGISRLEEIVYESKPI